MDHPKCSVCARADRAEIDAALALGAEGVNAIARRFSLSKPTLLRHRAHAGTAPPSEQAAVEPAPAAPPEAAPDPGPVELPPVPVELPGDDLVDFVHGLASASADPVTPSRVGRGRVCACCSSTLRAEVERRLCAGESAAAIEAALSPRGPSRQSITHHARVCVPHLLGARAAELREEIAGSLREEAEHLLREAKLLVQEAKENPEHFSERAKAINALAKAIDTLGRVTGELTAAVDVRVVLDSPRWQAEREAIAEALLPYPEAAGAVVARLRALPAGGAR